MGKTLRPPEPWFPHLNDEKAVSGGLGWLESVTMALVVASDDTEIPLAVEVIGGPSPPTDHAAPLQLWPIACLSVPEVHGDPFLCCHPFGA